MDVQYQEAGQEGKESLPEITPEMMRVGGDLIEELIDVYPPDELAGRVFRAMARQASLAKILET